MSVKKNCGIIWLKQKKTINVTATYSRKMLELWVQPMLCIWRKGVDLAQILEVPRGHVT